MSKPEPDDLTMTMQGFRMLRDGGFKTANEVLAAMQADFPNASEQKLRAILATIAAKYAETHGYL